MKEVYLGDGLYASDDGYIVRLRAPREYQDHYVALETDVLMAFIRFIETARDVKISIVDRAALPVSSADECGGEF